MTSTLIHEAHALEDQARALLPADVVAEALRARVGRATSTRGPNAEALRRVARTLRHGAALAILKRADVCYWAFAMSFRRFASQMAMRLRPSDPAGAYQWAMVGLYKAAVRFDPSTGLKFTTYAKHQVKAAILREMDDNDNPITMTEHCRVDTWTLRRVLAQHPEWTTANILAFTGWLPQRLSRVQEAEDHSSPALDIDQRHGKGRGFSLAETISLDGANGADDNIASAQAHTIAHAILARLPAKEANVLRQRYGIDNGQEMSMAEVGVVIGRSKQRVQQIEVLALKHAREILATNAHRQAA